MLGRQVIVAVSSGQLVPSTILVRSRQIVGTVGGLNNCGGPTLFLPNPSSHLILHQPLQMDDKPLTYFAPCIPIPRVWDQARSLKDLKDALNPQCPHYCIIEGMHPNLRAVIHA